MKVLVFGDVHLGAGVDDDICHSFSSLLRQAVQIKPDLIVITGDLYDGSTRPEHRNLAVSMCENLAKVSSVDIIRGNHDEIGDLDLLGKIAAPNPINVFDVCVIRRYFTAGQEVVFTYLPWVNKSSYAAMFPTESIADSDKSLGALVVEHLRGQVAKFPDKKHYLFGHLTVAGARAQNNQPLIGEGVTVGYHDLVDCGYAGGVFGHIHLRQRFAMPFTDDDFDGGRPHFWYPGSLAALNYGEIHDAKGFIVLDTDTGIATPYDVQCPLRLTFDAVWDGSLTLDCADHDLAGNYVRVKLIVLEGYSADDARAAIRKQIDQYTPKELKIVTQTRPREQLRAPEIARAETAAEKISAYWRATNSAPDEPMRTLILDKTSELEAACYLAK